MGRHKNYIRDEVLERAMNLFWAKGYEGTHLKELVGATGLNRFGLYNEFGGKEGLFQEALERYLSQALAFYREKLGNEPYGLNNIHDYFASLSYGEAYHGCFMINTLTEKHIVTEKAFDAASATVKKAERMFFKNLAAAQNQGELGKARDVKVLSKLLATLDHGLAIYGIVTPSDRDKDKILRQVDELLS